MKKFITLALASLALIATPAMADTAIGIVNFAKISQDSKAANSVRTQIQAKQKALQAEVSDKAKALHDEDQALVKQKDTATDKAAFQKKVADFQAKAAAQEREVQNKKVALDKSYAAALEEIQKALQDVVKQVAADKKLNLVLNNGTVLYSDASYDITDEVLKRLDAKLPNVSVKF